MPTAVTAAELQNEVVAIFGNKIAVATYKWGNGARATRSIIAREIYGQPNGYASAREALTFLQNHYRTCVAQQEKPVMYAGAIIVRIENRFFAIEINDPLGNVWDDSNPFGSFNQMRYGQAAVSYRTHDARIVMAVSGHGDVIECRGVRKWYHRLF